MGPRSPTRSRSCRRCSVTGACAESWTKSPGTVRGEPYTRSAGDALRSSFGVVRRPRSTQGNSSAQFGPVSRALSAALTVLCSLSIIPLACGWYAVVGCSSVPRRLDIALQRSETNCVPLSEVMWLGTPKRAIQPWTYACAIVLVSMSLIGKASGQRVKRSITVRRYLQPRDSGRGPTMSIWTWSNLLTEGAKFWRGAFTWV